MLKLFLNATAAMITMNAVSIVPYGAGATEAQIAAIEQAMGTSLPQDYREFLARYNGGCPSTPAGEPIAFPVHWTTQTWGKDFRVGFLRCLYTADDVPGVSLAWVHNDHVFRQVRSIMPMDTVPIGGDLGSNSILLGISGGNRGKIFYWVNEYAPVRDDAEPTHDNVGLIANSFTEFLQSLYPWKETPK